MEIIDVSLPLHPGMAVYEGDPAFELEHVARRRSDDPNSWNTSRFSLGTHTGTHVDSPRHFDNQGKGVDVLPLGVLCGLARVIDVRGYGVALDPAVFRDFDLTGVERVLLRTDTGEHAGGPFNRDYAHLTAESAQWLRDRRLRLIGIDSPSVEGFDSPGMPVHHVLLAVEPVVVVVEGLDLRNVEAGDYQLICLPLKVMDGDGAPARAVLVRP